MPTRRRLHTIKVFGYLHRNHPTDQSKAMEPHNERDEAGAMSGQALSGQGNGHRRPKTWCGCADAGTAIENEQGHADQQARWRRPSLNGRGTASGSRVRARVRVRVRAVSSGSGGEKRNALCLSFGRYDQPMPQRQSRMTTQETWCGFDRTDGWNDATEPDPRTIIVLA